MDSGLHFFHFYRVLSGIDPDVKNNRSLFILFWNKHQNKTNNKHLLLYVTKPNHSAAQNLHLVATSWHKNQSCNSKTANMINLYPFTLTNY